MLFQVLLIAVPFLLVFSTQFVVVRFWAKKDGFKPITYNLRDFGPVLLTNRWGSVGINKRAWGRTVTITLFRQHIHLKLAAYLGGGELVIPLQGAIYSFSRWRRGDLVNIQVDRKTYQFGGPIPKAVKQHYS